MPAAPLLKTTLELLGELVAFDTTSHRSNLELIEFVQAYLSRFGVDSHRISNKDGAKANLSATIGPDAEGGIVLSGHTDVVPVAGQPWTSEPFHLTHKGARLYGRGTADMKSFIAACLALVPAWSRLPLKAPLHLAFSYDEEIGCLGVPSLAEHIAKRLPKVKLVVIGEPTEMQVVRAHKGVYSFETAVTGYEAHSSQPGKGVNAVETACRLVAFLSGMALELSQLGLQDALFDPPFSTVHVGVIEGGTARNIIPRHCRFLWEIRPLPGESAEALLKRFKEFSETEEKKIRASFPETAIVTRQLSRMRGYRFDGAQEMETLLMRAAGVNGLQAVSFGTEAGVFHAHRLPALVCGPGSIAQAHKPDEFIETAQIEKCLAFLQRLAESLC